MYDGPVIDPDVHHTWASPAELVPYLPARARRAGAGERAVAIRNVCPHAGAPLCRGVVSPLVTASLDGPVASVRAEDERLMVSCPWHGWEFDVDTGQALADPRMRVKTYPLIVRDGRVLLEVGG